MDGCTEGDGGVLAFGFGYGYGYERVGSIMMGGKRGRL